MKQNVKREFVKRMDELLNQNGGICDTEYIHEEADKILCDMLIELGHNDIVSKFRQLEKWYA